MASFRAQSPVVLVVVMLYLLLVASGASAGTLRERAEESPSPTPEPASSATDSSAFTSVSPTSIPDSISDAPTRPTIDASSVAGSAALTTPATGTASSNSTTSGHSNSTSINSAQSSNSTCKKTNIEAEKGSGPFCQPNDGEKITANKTHEIAWDNSHFDPNSTVILKIKYLPNATTKSDSNSSEEGESAFSDLPILWETSVPQSVFNISPNFDVKWLDGHNSTNLTLYIEQDASEKGEENDSKTPPVYPGPMFTLLAPNTTNSTSQKSSSSSNETGKKAGISIGTIFFIGVILALAFCFRRQILAKCSSILGGKGGGGGARGYTGSEARRHTGLGNDAYAVGHGTGDSFQDEPMRGGGMELQDRGRQGNVFRDEVDRQRGVRR